MCYSEPLATPSATEPLCYSMRCYSSDTARYSECDVTPELSTAAAQHHRVCEDRLALLPLMQMSRDILFDICLARSARKIFDIMW